jgi:hypothetical protein
MERKKKKKKKKKKRQRNKQEKKEQFVSLLFPNISFATLPCFTQYAVKIFMFHSVRQSCISGARLTFQSAVAPDGIILLLK